MSKATFIAVLLSLTAGNARANDASPEIAESALDTVATTAVDPNEVRRWHQQIDTIARPQSKGCFGIEYPSTTWVEQPCVNAPEIPLLPVHRPELWDTNDDLMLGDIAANNSALQGNVRGYFAGGSLHSLTDSSRGAGYWSGQLNTNFFSTPACSGAANPSACQGFQQYVFSQPGGTTHGYAYIQYWLINYNNTCPSGWTTYGTGTGNYCYKNSVSVQSGCAGSTSVAETLSIQGEAYSDNDFLTAKGYLCMQHLNNVATVLDLAAGWHNSEFNIFGYGNGSSVSAASGDYLQVSIDTLSPTSCISQTYTQETSNFTLGSCCLSSNSQGIRFRENVGSTPSTCP